MIKRYYPQQCCLGRDVYMEQQLNEGAWVKYKDHNKIIKKLKAEIEQAVLARLDEELSKIYNKGYDDGRWAGYHELNNEFGVIDKEDLK